MPSDAGRLKRAMASHLRLVWRVLRRCGLSERDADEAAQDVFWVLHRRHDDVPAKAERSFLVSTAIKIAADRRRALAARPETELQSDPPVRDMPTDEIVALRHARRLLDEALDCLSEEQRAVFVLVEMEELTAPETADLLDIPPGTVASRLKAARQAFDAAVRRLRLRGLRGQT